MQAVLIVRYEINFVEDNDGWFLSGSEFGENVDGGFVE